MLVGGRDIFDAKDLKALSVSNTICFKHTRLVSCDVERTFSQYKPLFRDNRHGFAVHSLK
jgi:hypothetical protein